MIDCEASALITSAAAVRYGRPTLNLPTIQPAAGTPG